MKAPLPQAPKAYDPNNENQAREAIRRAFERAYARGEDVELQPGQRFIFSSPNGVRYRLEVNEAGLPFCVPLDRSGLGIVASEALSAGDKCNIYTSGGVAKIQKADATDASKPANAFVLAAFGIGDVVTPYGIGQANTALSGLTPGATYWLSTTPGHITTTPPSGSGNDVVQVGTAWSATILMFAPQRTVQL